MPGENKDNITGLINNKLSIIPGHFCGHKNVLKKK